MPIPPPPGPPPPHTLSQLSAGGEEAGGRGVLLSDICRGTQLRKVEVQNDRSAPLLDSKSATPPTEHPYIRLYQYLHQSQQGGPSQELRRTAGDRSAAPPPQKSRASGASAGANRSTSESPPGSAQPKVQVPKQQPIRDGSSGRPSSSTRGAAPRPPSHRCDGTDRPLPQASSPTECRPHPPSLPSLLPSPTAAAPSPSMKPPPPPSHCHRGNTSSPPTSSYNREKPLPPTPPLPSKPPPSPNSSKRPPTSGGNPAPSSSSSLAPPPPPYRITNGPAVSGEVAPELPQRHNSLSSKRTAPSPGSHTPTRGPAPPPPSSPTPSQLGTSKPPPTNREGSGRGTAPPHLALCSPSLRVGAKEAPPPPPYRTHGSPSLSSDPPFRGKPPPPPSRIPAPPPPPPHRNGPPPSPSITRSFADDFEARYSFHPLDDFPPPDEYRHFSKIYPSRANRVMRGAPPLPPVGR
ncbi:WAS/WASL-interacting protein family member 2 isoform X2 [Oryzias latipes]|nr:WAS/WASL-interacting protein family member 2 isoform X2 [Oryzias latipes]XP_023812948.1 WAS/WASL-interacting protein family member 2 isoform X2 [Oryzias latipes]